MPALLARVKALAKLEKRECAFFVTRYRVEEHQLSNNFFRQFCFLCVRVGGKTPAPAGAAVSISRDKVKVPRRVR